MKTFPFYPQSTLESCGIACMLMIMKYFGIDTHPDPVKEMNLYKQYGADCTAGTLGSSLAYALSRRRMNVTLVHSSAQMIENRNGYYSDELHRAMLAEYQADIERAEGSFHVETGTDTGCDRLRHELEQNRVLIVQCFVEGDADGMHDHVLHWVVAYGFKNGQFLVCDPLSGKLRLSEKELSEYMDTPLGACFLSVSKKR